MTVVASALVVSLGLAGVAVVASAYTGTGAGGAPSWVPGDSSRKGAVLFYDGDGNQISQGTDINNVGVSGLNTGWLAVSGGALGAGAIRLNGYVAAPSPTNAIPSTWATNNVPPLNFRWGTATGVPAAVAANPAFLHLNASGGAFQDLASGLVLYTGPNAEYKNVLEIRLLDTVDVSNYWATDIEYNPTSAASAYDGLAPGAWRIVWPVPTLAVATTTTTPTVAPAGATHASGTSLTFSTTVAAASGSIAGGGSVKFFDGVTQLGATKTVAGPVGTSPVAVSSDAISSLGVGSHSITAQFTPSGSGFTGSTSGALAQSITAVSVATATTTPTVSPAGASHVQGTSLTFSTTVAAASGSIAGGGTVSFFDGVTQLGATKNVAGPVGTTPVAVSSDAISSSGVGSHSITAQFTPSGSGFTGSTSGALAQDITAPSDVATTTTTPTVAPAGASHLLGTSLTFSTTVVPASGSIASGGTVTFFDGGTQLGAAKTVSGPVAAGSPVSVSSDAISSLSVGSHSITAHFVPGGTGFAASTSGGLAQQITAPVDVATSTTTPTVAPAGATHVQGTSLTFSTTVAAVSGSIAAGGTVTFFDGATQLGAPKGVAGPVGTSPVSVSSDAISGLGLGSHSITAHFAPGGTGFAASTSGGLAQQITAPVDVATTTTTPTVSPAGASHVQGASLAFTTTVVPASGTIASGGTVTFLDGVTQLGAAKPVAGPIAAGSPVSVDSDAITNLGVGNHAITAHFTPGGTGFAASTSGALSQQITSSGGATATSLVVATGSGAHGASAAVGAVLTAGATPLVGQFVSLTLNGAEICTGVTDATGMAVCSLTPLEAAGDYPLAASFAGTADLAPSSGSGTFHVTSATTKATVLSLHVPETLRAGHWAAFRVSLRVADGRPVAGRTVVVTLGSGATAQTCAVTTNLRDRGWCVIPSVNQPAGRTTVRAQFAGDSVFAGSVASSTVVVRDRRDGGCRNRQDDDWQDVRDFGGDR